MIVTLIDELEQEASTPLVEALIDITVKVAGTLLQQDAILLPDVCDNADKSVATAKTIPS